MTRRIFGLFLRIGRVLPLLLMLSACTRNVQWEEEVPLNTGETIVVKRSGTHSYGSRAGNPLDYGHSPDQLSTIEFIYKGKKYSHTSEASLVLLVIAPHGVPYLVANPANWGWGNRNSYSCDAPYYVQFQPSDDGKKWQWPDRIDRWLYSQPTNLIQGIAAIAEDGKKFTPQDRRVRDELASSAAHYRLIDPTYTYDACIRRK